MFNDRFLRGILMEVLKATDDVLWKKLDMPTPTLTEKDIR